MNSIKTIMLNSFAREIRSKFLFMFSFFTICLIALMTLGLVLFQDFLTENENLKMLVGGKLILVVYTIVDFWSTFISIVFGVNAVLSDSENQIMPQILSHPISRTHYLIGRVLGSWLMVGLFYAVSLFLAITIFSITTGEQAFSIEIVYAIFPSMFRCLAIILLSVFASQIFSRVTAMISMGFFVFVLGIANSHFIKNGFGEATGVVAIFKALGLVLHWLFPRIGSMSAMSTDLTFGTSGDLNYPLELIHFVIFMGIYFFLLFRSFQKRDI